MRKWDANAVKTLRAAVFTGNESIVEVVRGLGSPTRSFSSPAMACWTLLPSMRRTRLDSPNNVWLRYMSGPGRGTKSWPINLWQSSTKARHPCFVRCRSTWSSWHH
ncbi:hypothetical protein [Mycobacterium haemophilum]